MPILRVMRPMRATRVAVLAVIAGGLLLTACFTEPCTKPIVAGVVAHVGVPTVRTPDPDRVGACAQWIIVDGRSYRDQRSNGWEFDLSAADLVDVGAATEASPLVGELAGPTVFSIDDLDPKHFLAIQAADGSFFIIVPDGTENTVEVDAFLCRYAIGMDHMIANHCRAGEPPPSG